jgi:hypothetical protein
MTVLSRIERKIAKHGEEFLVNGVTPERGFFQLLDTGRMRTYFDDTEVMAIVRPTLFLVTSHDAQIAAGDTIVRDGRTYTIRKIVIERLGGTAMVKLAALT